MEEPKKEDYDFNDVFELAAYTHKLRKLSEAQQQEIEQLKEDLLISNNSMTGIQMINTNLKEEIRILKQYEEIARNDKHQRKARLNEELEEIKELKK